MCTASYFVLLLVNEIANFMKSSYKRMKEWEKQMAKEGAKSNKRLQAICETRWWAKDKALDRIFGSFGKPSDDSSLYAQVLMTLTSIALDESLDSTA